MRKGRRGEYTNCPDCSGDVIAPQGPTGEKVCNHCGLVIEKPASVRGFTQWTPKWFSNWEEADSETLKEWLTTLRLVSCQLQIPKFPYTEEVARTIRRGNRILAQSQNLGKNKRATVAALVHLILKQYNKTRPIREICQELSLDSKLVNKQTWILNGTIKNQTPILNIQRKNSKDYLTELGSKMTNNQEIIKTAQETLALVQKKGGNPVALASGALYHAYKLNKTRISKEQIAQAFGISPRTVDTNERRIRNILANRTPEKIALAITF